MAFTPFDPNADDNSGATSYGSVAGLRDYGASRKKSVPTSDSDCEVVLTLAMDYLEAQADRYQGIIASQANLTSGNIYSDGYTYISDASAIPQQPLQWPRANVFLFNSPVEFDRTKLPPQLLKAQYEMACVIASGIDPFPVSDGAFIKSEKVDVIETVYSEIVRNTGSPDIPSVDAILAPLFSVGGGLGVQVGRA